MTGGDWHDPFADDEAARAREQRRAEREARRKQSRASLGEKVGEAEAAAREPAEHAPRPEPEPAPRPDPEPESRASAPVPPTPPRGAGPSTAAGRSRPLGRVGGGTTRDRELAIRRLIGLAVVLAVLVIAVIGVKAVADRLGNDPPPAPPAEPQVSELVVPEGLTREQIADLVKKEGIKGDYMKATKSFKGFDPAEYGAEGAPSLEGFLFPATYELPKKATVRDLVARQLEAFETNLAEVDLAQAKSKNLTAYDVVKIASMVEKEIQVPEERRLAAAVIYNRLKQGTPLGIDATIRYEDGNYDEQLTESRLAEDTPYNSRTRTGLPPTPIANPGLASLQAAAKPANSDAFFFVVKPGTCGEHVFVETEEEFAQAEAEYQAALQAEGGSPTDCD